MSKLIYTSLIITSLFIFACSKDSNVLNPSRVKVYFFDNNNANNDVYCFDAKALVNNEILVFGVNSSSDNRFETGGKLYLQKMNVDGDTVWRTYKDFKGGFPSNVLKKSDTQFVLFWTNNGSFKAVTIDISGGTPKIDTTHISTLSPFVGTSSIINAAIDKDGGYLILGTASTGATKNIYLSKLNNQFANVQFLSQQEYNIQSFGTLGTDDLPYIKRFGKFCNLIQINNLWYFVAPYKTKMALKQVGNVIPIFEDATKWINTSDSIAVNGVSALLSHPDNTSEIYFAKKLEVNKIEQTSSTVSNDALTGWDTSSPLIIKYLKDQNCTLIAGTSKQGQIKLEIYDATGTKTATHDELGQAYPYKLAQIVVLTNNSIAIVGTTMIQNQFKRIFYIKLPLSEL